MEITKNKIFILIISFIFLLNVSYFSLAAPSATILRNILPENNSLYDMGSTTPLRIWKNVFTQNASTSALIISGTPNCSLSQALITSSDGTVSCGTISGMTFAWTPSSTYGENTNSTTTPIWLKDTLYASSTSFFTGLATFANATITQSTITDAWITKLQNLTSNGFVKTGSGDGTLSIDTSTYIGATRQLTIAGTAGQITSSAGAQDLSADRTWTLSLPNHIIFPSSFVVTNASSTNATTTSLSVSGLLNIGGDYLSELCGTGLICTGNTLATSLGASIDISDETNLTSTWPVILTGDTLSFGGLSTSTAAVQGNIPYFSGVNTFANIATTSATIGDGLSYSGTFGSVIGGSAGTLTASLGTAIDLTSAEVTDNFTDGSVLFWGTTSISQDNTNLSFNDSLNRLTITYASSTAISATNADFTNISGTLSTAAQANITSLGTLTGLTSTGVIDFGGATSFELPNGSPIVNAAGEIAIDVTSGQLKWFNDGSTHIITGTTTRAFNIATTTLDIFGKNIRSGTTSLVLINDPEPLTLIGFYCKATTTSASITAHLRFGDNENWTETGVCPTAGSFTKASTNNTFTAFEDFVVQASSTAITSNLRLIITAFFNKTAD